MKKFLTMILVCLLCVGMLPVTAFAESYEPYSHIWTDDNNGVINVQYYDYDVRSNTYRISDRVSIIGNQLFDMKGIMIVSDLATFTKDKPSVVFDANGELYFISKDGQTRHMETSLDETFEVSTFVSKYFGLDFEDLGAKVYGKTTKNLDNLSFSGKYSRHTNPVVEDTCYVKAYAHSDSAETVCMDAYFNSKAVVSISCHEGTVWCETVKRMLTENAKGPKFVGYLSNYSVLFYDLDKKLIEYRYSDGFVKAYPVMLDTYVYCFNFTDNGFISSAKTSQGTYSFSTKISFPGGTPNSGNINNSATSGTVTNVKNFTNKSMAYSGDTHLGTLSAKKGVLSWKGTTLANSKKSSEFGITASCTPVWINGEDELYMWNGSSTQLIATNVLRLKYNDDIGIVTSYKAADGNWYTLK